VALSVISAAATGTVSMDNAKTSSTARLITLFPENGFFISNTFLFINHTNAITNLYQLQ
jgi:hypothetical protein